jgi:hypothetical protein
VRLTPVLIAEIEAALVLVDRHRPSAVLLRLSSDRGGVVRLTVERVEGVPLTARAVAVEVEAASGSPASR